MGIHAIIFPGNFRPSEGGCCYAQAALPCDVRVGRRRWVVLLFGVRTAKRVDEFLIGGTLGNFKISLTVLTEAPIPLFWCSMGTISNARQISVTVGVPLEKQGRYVYLHCSLVAFVTAGWNCLPLNIPCRIS